MDQSTLRIVAADDDDMNLEIMLRNLSSAGYETAGFHDGTSLLSYVKEHPKAADVIILDKIMPSMSGVEVLRRLKEDASLHNIPVIIQTGDVGMAQMQESLEAGAYYYLPKPFEPDMMVSLVRAAVRDCVQRTKLLEQMHREKSATYLMEYGRFLVRTLEDARRLSASLSHHARRSKEVALVLSELMINGIEHGNLKIGYEEKRRLIREGGLDSEIEKRLLLPGNRDKCVKVTMQQKDHRAKVTIEDMGEGFDWHPYTNIDPTRFIELNGRGIAYASLMAINIQYLGNGNTVECRFETI